MVFVFGGALTEMLLIAAVKQEMGNVRWVGEALVFKLVQPPSGLSEQKMLSKQSQGVIDQYTRLSRALYNQNL
ncbi:hypothetical protein FRB94_006054 [Tulasnella sp. JGI-2019a]|nr:hypothetical protein FRB94_006054 [Tulasnella sp. JGI-2019a]